MANILIVHSVCDTRRFLCSVLSQEGHSVECVGKGRSLFDILGTRKDIDLVLVRLAAGKKDSWSGNESVEMARVYGTNAKFVVINGECGERPSDSCVLSVPFTREELLDVINAALDSGS